MSITREDIIRFTEYQNNEKQLELFEYWNPPVKDRKPTDLVSEFIKASGQKIERETADLYVTLIEEELNEWKEARESGDKPNELKELCDLLYVIYGYAYVIGWNIEEAFKEVHKNNVGRMFQPDGTIKRRPDGKVEKNKNYPKVNLENFV